MWASASNAIAGTIGLKKCLLKPSQASSECSDDDISVNNSGVEGLECPICWESFNIVENVPYVLWCGHTLCKNCVLGLQWALVKLPTLPIQLPFFISCPWCNMLSCRLMYKGNLKFPRKNFFLLWMVENMNGDRAKSHSSLCGDHQPAWSSNRTLAMGNQVSHANHSCAPCIRLPEQMESNHDEGPLIGSYLNAERLHLCLRKSLVFFVHLTAKFPLVIIFLLIVFYAIPASAAILALYILITVLFAVPSFLVLYFAYPSLDWLVREIIT
uniref:RING-type domain-containing protein n=1 Tax=Davidia involucrata TaxID=16924 RepID=A0A5B7BC54_DAVIN